MATWRQPLSRLPVSVTSINTATSVAWEAANGGQFSVSWFWPLPAKEDDGTVVSPALPSMLAAHPAFTHQIWPPRGEVSG